MAVLSAESDLQVTEERAAHRVFPVTAKFTKHERQLVKEFARSQGIARGQWMRDITTMHLRVRLAAAHVSMTPLQRSYITEYIRSQVGATFNAHEGYRLLYLGGGKSKPRLAFPVDFVPGKTALPDGKIMPVALSELASLQGYRWFYRGPEQKLGDLSLNRWLRLTVFEDKGLWGLFAITFVEGGVCLAAMLWFAVPYDIRRFKQMKYGRILRGPRRRAAASVSRRLSWAK